MTVESKNIQTQKNVSQLPLNLIKTNHGVIFYTITDPTILLARLLCLIHSG